MVEQELLFCVTIPREITMLSRLLNSPAVRLFEAVRGGFKEEKISERVLMIFLRVQFFCDTSAHTNADLCSRNTRCQCKKMKNKNILSKNRQKM